MSTALIDAVFDERIRSMAAPSSAIAVEARRFGDDYPPVQGQWRMRAATVVLVLAAAAYVPWMLASLDTAAWWIALPFAVANLVSVGYGLLLATNAWERKVPERRPLRRGREPLVGVIIPTCGEAVPMVLRTVLSVLEQDWPMHRMVVVVSDDGHDEALRSALEGLPVEYYSPPDRWSRERAGAAKAGNLNAALAHLTGRYPEIAYVETRDADDETGTRSFLREVVGQLQADPGLAFVQTIKEAAVSPGDPFNNRETLFYRGQMLAKNAANAVFPCGSGVVWRRTALEAIGNFPTWNLVEDVQSGVEALRRGWRGMYLPIVGAVGQHAPEDLPNAYKQRATWATDSVRLVVWGDLRGLGWRQRLQFWEICLCYLNAFTVPVYVACLALTLGTGHGPLDGTTTGYLLFMLPLALASELWLLVAFRPFNDRRRRQRRYLLSVWRARIVWNGLAPVYMLAATRALAGGRRRKPPYRVTRKCHDVRWHWRSVVPHGLIALTLAASAAYGANRGVDLFPALVPTLYWAGLIFVLSVGFVGRSWHGYVPLRRRLGSAVRAVTRPLDPRPTRRRVYVDELRG